MHATPSVYTRTRERWVTDWQRDRQRIMWSGPGMEGKLHGGCTAQRSQAARRHAACALRRAAAGAAALPGMHAHTRPWRRRSSYVFLLYTLPCGERAARDGGFSHRRMPHSRRRHRLLPSHAALPGHHPHAVSGQPRQAEAHYTKLKHTAQPGPGHPHTSASSNSSSSTPPPRCRSCRLFHSATASAIWVTSKNCVARAGGWKQEGRRGVGGGLGRGCEQRRRGAQCSRPGGLRAGRGQLLLERTFLLLGMPSARMPFSWRHSRKCRSKARRPQ